MNENGTQINEFYFSVYSNCQVILKTYPIKKLVTIILEHLDTCFGINCPIPIWKVESKNG